MAKVLGVSESGYYKWLNRLNGEPSEKEKLDVVILQQIQEIFRNSRGSFGSRKIVKIINKASSCPINHKRVERLMRDNYIFSKASRKYIHTTDSNHDEPIADNLIDRDFEANAPNEKMVSDTTVISTKQGNLYVAGIIDLYGRMPVGVSMSLNNDRYLVMDALEDLLIRGYGAKDCILHSDRGSTYASKDYRRMLNENGFICSMSKKGDCWDNAPMESFWGKMKQEWLKEKYATIEEAAKDVYEYVWHFYPRERPHASNGYRTPAEVYYRV